jgi:hypothetical protein
MSVAAGVFGAPVNEFGWQLRPFRSAERFSRQVNFRHDVSSSEAPETQSRGPP